MTVARTRGQGAAACVAALFAALWFNWGLAAATSDVLRNGLQGGRVASVVVAVIGLGIAAFGRNGDHGETAERDRDVMRHYGLVVGAEFAVLAVGNVVLANTDQTRWIPVWVCAVVGVHFLPLARLFGLGLLRVLAALMTALAAATVIASTLSSVAPSTVVGTGAGLCLLGFAALSLVGQRQR